MPNNRRVASSEGAVMDAVISFIKVLLTVAPGAMDVIKSAIEIWSNQNGADAAVILRQVAPDTHKEVDREVDAEIIGIYGAPSVLNHRDVLKK